MFRFKRAFRAVAFLAVAISLTLFGATAVGAQEPGAAAPAPDTRGLPGDSGAGRRVVF
ncbi:hypothetical protein BH10ACT3_BH10ACT3_08710 [soil metagenome]